MNFNMDLSIPKIKVSIRVVAVILLILGLYVFYWTTNTKVPEIDKQTKSLTSQNSSLATTENNLKVLYESMDYYLAETQRLIAETDELLTEFPTFMYLEDKILYAHDLLEGDLNGYNLSSFTYGQSQYKTSVKYGVDENLMELYSVAMSGKYQDLTYAKVKDLLQYGLDSPQRFVLSNLTVSYNEDSGYLNGEFNFNTYFIPGQPEPYEFPPYVIEGLGGSNRIDNLFGARK